MRAPTTIERIADWVIANRGVYWGPLNYIGTRSSTADGRYGFNVTGVIIPANGDRPSERIMLVDMGMEPFREMAPPMEDRPSRDVPNFGESLKPMRDDGPAPSDIGRGPWKSNSPFTSKQ